MRYLRHLATLSVIIALSSSCQVDLGPKPFRALPVTRVEGPTKVQVGEQFSVTVHFQGADCFPYLVASHQPNPTGCARYNPDMAHDIQVQSYNMEADCSQQGSRTFCGWSSIPGRLVFQSRFAHPSPPSAQIDVLPPANPNPADLPIVRLHLPERHPVGSLSVKADYVDPCTPDKPEVLSFEVDRAAKRIRVMLKQPAATASCSPDTYELTQATSEVSVVEPGKYLFEATGYAEPFRQEVEFTAQ